MPADLADFPARLDFLLAGRMPAAWSRQLGIQPNMVTRMRAGHIPGHEVLMRIMRAENVSLSWFTAGLGTPFLVNSYLLYEDFEEDFQKATGADPDSALHILDSVIGPVLILKTPQQNFHPGKRSSHQAGIHVFATLWSERLKALLETRLEQEQSHYHFLPEADTREIGRGRVGTFRIFGDDSSRGLLDQANVSTVPRFDRRKTIAADVREAREDYVVDAALMRATISTVEGVCQAEGLTLSHEQKARVITAVFRHLQRAGLSARNIDINLVLSVVEAV
ncbi:MAG: hypothetical protein RQ899_13110 [Pseudomonadales bacterium]|nr:hypothetical protein [Pseudomonadales bacterium]